MLLAEKHESREGLFGLCLAISLFCRGLLLNECDG
jgi:hypothetical protein